MCMTVTVVGVGASGWEVTRCLRDRLKVPMLGWLPTRGLVDARDEMPGLVGVGADPDLVRVKVREQLRDHPVRVKEPFVALVGDTTVASGAGGLPVLSRALVESGTMVVALVVADDSPVSRLAVRCVAAHAASVVIVDEHPALVRATRTLLGASEPGVVGVDPDDLRLVYAQDGRRAYSSVGVAVGAERSRIAAAQAVEALHHRARDFTRSLFVRVSAGPPLRFWEIADAVDVLSRALRDDLVFSAVIDEALEDEFEIGVLATGVDSLRCT